MMPLAQQLLKMKSNHHKFIYLLILCFSLSAYSQQDKKETVFITKNDSVTTPPKEEFLYRQLALSVPIIGNRYYDPDLDDDGTQWYDVVMPDGVSAHLGYGLHYHSWVTLALNAGIDYTGRHKLVNAPVYASLMLNPHFGDDHSLILQGGYGYSFAIGRGSLSGTYQKYRLGIGFDDSYALFIEVNVNQFPLHGDPYAAYFNVGIMAFEFL